MSTNIWWLSFVDDSDPSKERAPHLGCCLVEAKGMLEAVKEAHRLEINPGGQVRGIEMPDSEEARAEVESLGMNRLISPKELHERGYLSEREKEEVRVH